MGTRSLTIVHDEGLDSPELCVMYRQFDGYPSGHGQELADFLGDIELVNGLRGGEGRVANGMGCLAAQVITHFKTKHGVGGGGIYLYPNGTRDCGEEFTYHVYAADGGIDMSAEESYGGGELFRGRPRDFDGSAIEKDNGDEDE